MDTFMINKTRLASELTGIGGNSGGLQKLTIYHEENTPYEFEGKVVALFNPNQLTIGHTASWEARQQAQVGNVVTTQQDFQSTKPATLSINLFFDTYESHDDRLSLAHLRSAILPTHPLLHQPEATSVQKHTTQLVALTQIKRELHRPPICKLRWGSFKIFEGVLTSLTQTFTMFMPDGMPVRAEVQCQFTQYTTTSRVHQLASGETLSAGVELNSADVPKQYTVKRHDTLQSIAARLYNDPRQWRRIAQANKLTNPRRLKPGQILLIPKNE